ncbi:MAG: phosphatase PAP2 family protein [Flavobacteriales bacterium]|jgi:membrane-associated phospholipid phosphatase|nr:phosphatase PAP2 family protein [Flavobacteriales bacterium]
MKLINKISVFFSVTFQPLFMPFVAVLMMLLLNDTVNNEVPVETRKYVMWISFLFTIILPAMMFLLFYKMGWVSDLNLTVRKERVVPTFLALLLYFTLYYLVRNSEGMLPEFIHVVVGCIVGILVANIVTAFWKISIHALGVFSVVGSLVAISIATGQAIPVFAYVFLAIAVTVGVSRIILKRHTPMQVVMGALLGFLSPFLASYFEVYI